MATTYGSLTISAVNDGTGLYGSIPYYLATSRSSGVLITDPGWSREVPELTPTNKYLWIYYVNNFGEGDTEPELITVYGDVVTFENHGDTAPVNSCIVELEPIQSGSGDPSPSNVRPISGWTGVNVTRTGKNLIRPQGTSSTTLNGVTFTVNSDGSVNVNGTASANTYYLIGIAYLVSGISYVLSGGINASKRMQLTDYPVVNNKGFDNGSGLTFTAETGVNYGVRIFIASGTSVSNETLYPMIRLASITDSTYEPRITTIYPVTFPQSAGTVYGGYVDVTNGKLVVDRAKVDLGTLTWTYQSSTNLFYSGAFTPMKANSTKGLVSNGYVLVGSQTETRNTDKSIAKDPNGRLYAHDSAYSTSASFQSAISGIDLVYELATPVEYDLDPQEILMLGGD